MGELDQWLDCDSGSLQRRSCFYLKNLLKVSKVQSRPFGITQESKNDIFVLFFLVGLVVEWSKAHVSCVLLLGYQGFEPWFQLELESMWKLPRRDFPFKASSGCK